MNEPHMPHQTEDDVRGFHAMTAVFATLSNIISAGMAPLKVDGVRLPDPPVKPAPSQ